MHYGLLSAGETIDLDLNYQHLILLQQIIETNRAERVNKGGVVVSHHDSAGHTALTNRQTLKKPG